MIKENTAFVVKKRTFADSFIDFISFNREVRHLVEILNTEIASPESVVFRPISHPAGFARLITKRRLTIAEAYIRLISHSQAKSYVERIEALQVLMHHVWHSKNLSMPINTARVQIALMKNAVKLRGNQRAQLELMSDFARASYGQTSVIRRLLRELDLIEVPETGEELSQMQLGWDDHVHDSMTEGRKSPSQLVLDAFIKGISRITVAYYDVAERQTYEEVFLAGQILGIRVQIGIEFSVGQKCQRTHFLYIPPQGWTFEALGKFFDAHEEKLAPFWEGLKENSARRHQTVNTLLENFNHTGLEKFNEAYRDLDTLLMEPLSWESVERVTSKGQANRIHLGQLIYQAMKPVALKRVLYLQNQYLSLKRRASRDASTAWEAERCFKKFESAKQDYDELTPSLCAEKFIAPQKQIDYDSAFASEKDILPLLSECGGYIVFIHPLSQGLQRGIDILFENYRALTDIEVFNLVDAITRDTIEIRQFALVLNTLQSGGDPSQVERLLNSWRLNTKPRSKIAKVMQYLSEHPLYMRCASDAVGWSSNVPGMGFIHESSLPPQSLKLLKRKGHAVIPQPATDLLQKQRLGNSFKSQNDLQNQIDSLDNIQLESLNTVESTERFLSGAARQRNQTDKTQVVYLLSSTQILSDHAVNDAHVSPKMRPLRIWRYINMNFRSLLLAAIGFIPAYFAIGIEFALLWFFITAFRNSIVDLIASSGLIPKSWQLKNIDRENLCTSLFFTGFSVPILAGAKAGFDYLWLDVAQLETGFLFTFIKFWCIAVANGIYLATHNTLRGFDKPAIRGNFFRSVLSWPLATIGSYILTPLGVPDVVQAKIASEIVAGIIEGTVKNSKQNKLAQKALLEIYRQLATYQWPTTNIAQLDILFFWARYSQGRRALGRFFRLNHPSAYHAALRKCAQDYSQITWDNANSVQRFYYKTKFSIQNVKRRIFKLKPKKSHGLQIQDIEDIRKGNALIAETFTTEGSLESLTYVILKYYPEENLNILTQFAGESHGAFLEWIEKRYQPHTPTRAIEDKAPSQT